MHGSTAQPLHWQHLPPPNRLSEQSRAKCLWIRSVLCKNRQCNNGTYRQYEQGPAWTPGNEQVLDDFVAVLCFPP